MNTHQRDVIGIGHNRPPVKELLEASYAVLLSEVEAAILSAQRAPQSITDDETLGKFGDLVDEILRCQSEVKDAHEAEKKPFLLAGRDVDDFFRAPKATLEDAKAELRKRQTVYLKAKDAAALSEAKRIADEAAAEAEAKFNAASKAQDSGNFDGATAILEEAVQADTVAAQAGAIVAAKPADRTRVYGTGGSVTSLRKEWTGEITDADKLDAVKLWPYVALSEKQKALRAFVKAGGRELSGARIFEEAKAR